jgi:hypothetical protein
MVDAGGKTPEKKSWADVEEEEEAKAKAAEAASGSTSKTGPTVEAQAKQIEALSLSPLPRKKLARRARLSSMTPTTPKSKPYAPVAIPSGATR